MTRRADAGERLLTVDEACRELRISRWTLYRLIRSHSVRSIKIGTRRLIPASALDDLVTLLQAEGE